MKCNFCFENEGKYKIRIYKEIWINEVRNDILLDTLFTCKKCLNKNMCSKIK